MAQEPATTSKMDAAVGETAPAWMSNGQVRNGWIAERGLVSRVTPGQKRTTVQVQIGERYYAGPLSAPVEEFVWQAVADDPPTSPPMAVLLDNRLRELSTPVWEDTSAQIVPMEDPDGGRIYRRSLTLLLLAAAKRVFPGLAIAIEHSLPFGAYYCTAVGREPLALAELTLLQSEMEKMVAEDLPITCRRASVEEMVSFFAASGDETKVSLLAYRTSDDLSIYTLDTLQNYFHGYMAPSTGYLRWFGLAAYGKGFLLRFPRRQQPVQLQPILPSTDLENVFQEYGEWMGRLGLQNLGSLNNAIVRGNISEVILISEALHERRVAHISGLIARTWEDASAVCRRIRVALIAGPSSSGKTTFAKRLGVQLLSHGIRPYALSLDNYFVDRAETPLDAEGDYDFESLQALNVPLLNDHLARLLAGEEVTLPHYNFMTGRSEVGETVRLEANRVLILEGIHGLNPELTSAIPPESTLRVYVSVLTHLNMDRHNRISTSDVRLLRRIARDHSHRGYSAADTIGRWASVRRGEERYIFPFQNNADVMFNSALLYELSVLRDVVEPLLLQIEWDSPGYVEARRLLAFLRWVRTVDADLVPDNSIIREFIGNSILRTFTLA
ncbi:MAG: nucleoside kinase [Chloroflexi bacterium]|nr:nucleoside kinase [Chloroflexota bacterium]